VDPMDSDSDRLSALKKAIVEIRTLRARVEEAEGRVHDPIAIVGYALRFPGASDGESFWRLLADGGDAISEIPRERWNIDEYYDADPDRPGKMYTREGGFLKSVDCFDARFFGISPREAASMDPQQRLFLEIAWQALENAGIPAEQLVNSATGVYVGISNCDYQRLLFEEPDRLDVYASLGTNYSVIAGRLSYLLGLRGPSLAVDTACSSSLVAAHLACQSLRIGECRVAIAGGVNLILAPDVHVSFCKAGLLARDNRCKAFDAAADGYVRSEGCGAIVLKRLADALADGDRIHAVIRGSAVNQDGKSSGLTAPNGPSQEAVIRAALANAKLQPSAIDFVETHGTGTSLGDPIEFGALGAALCEDRAPERPLLIGSVKTNLGHLEATAGMVGLLKMVLSLEYETLPPQLHFRNPNPHIDWSRWPITVATSPLPWPRNGRQRAAGVSSFGFSGTNAHVILEEAPALPERGRQRPVTLVTFSGKTEDTRRAAAEQLGAHLAAYPQTRLGDVAHTRNAGRAHHPFRAAVVAASCAELEESLRAFAENRQDGRTRSGWAQPGEPPEVVFLFTGQGAQHPDMGRALYDAHEVFRAEVDRCAAILSGVLDRPLLDLLYGDSGDKLYETIYAQPATFAFEYALAEQWKAWGVKPAAAMGHSLGEYVAACVGGAMTLEQGLKLVATRGRLMHCLPRGAMAAALASEARTLEAIAGRPGVEIASVNSPENVVLSGDEGEVAAVCQRLAAEGYTCKPIRIAQAAHSRLVESMLDALEAAARAVEMREPELELVSNVTGVPITKGDLGPGYWRKHARSQVRFTQGLQGLYERGYRVFLEIGPRPTLTGFVAEALPSPDVCAVASLRPDVDQMRELLDGLAVLYSRGVSIAWRELDRGYDHRKIDLPTYPFERDRFWFSDPAPKPVQETREGMFEICLQRTRAQSQQAPFDLSPQSFPQVWKALERLTLAYQTTALVQLGAFTSTGESYDPPSLCKIFGIAPTYTRLMQRWLEHLAEAGVLHADGFVFRADAPLLAPALEPLLRDAAEEGKNYPEFFQYVQNCGPALASILTGKQSALDPLFPQGSFDLADGLYHHSALSRYLNGMVRAALESALQSLPPGRPLRILEIGAGTGGTTAAVLPWLDSARTQYVFTDVSDLFLNRARERFAQFPFVRYSLFDIDCDPAEQGFPAGSFDVVIAANVLHATRDLTATIGRVTGLLGDAGLLLLSETTAHPRVFDITTGLIEGWQVFEDTLRTDNPLISAHAWVDLLKTGGFEAAAAFPEDGSPAAHLGNHVIVAGKPGASFATRVPTTRNVSLPDDAGMPSESVAAVAPTEAAALEELRTAHPAERRERLAEMARDAAIEILRLDQKRKPNLRDRLMELGFDSLMAIQFRNRLGSLFGKDVRLPATLVFDHPTCEAIGAYLAGLVEQGETVPGKLSTKGDGEAKAEPTFAATPSHAMIEELSEEAAEAALLERLDQLEGAKR
jgi:acyl transferase domain-containing protein/SAM-dependent methyltransferase